MKSAKPIFRDVLHVQTHGGHSRPRRPRSVATPASCLLVVEGSVEAPVTRVALDAASVALRPGPIAHNKARADELVGLPPRESVTLPSWNSLFLPAPSPERRQSFAHPRLKPFQNVQS